MIGETRTLTLQDPDSGLTFAIAFDRWDIDRAQWHYRISGPAGETFAEGSDLRDGCGAAPCEAKAMGTLLSFCGAFAEAIAYSRGDRTSDNRDLFPESFADAADAVGSDGFAMLAESVEVQS